MPYMRPSFPSDNDRLLAQVVEAVVDTIGELCEDANVTFPAGRIEKAARKEIASRVDDGLSAGYLPEDADKMSESELEAELTHNVLTWLLENAVDEIADEVITAMQRGRRKP